MSNIVTVLEYLLDGLCKAVQDDESGDGIDIPAGLLGQETSDWIRSVANGIQQNKDLIAKQSEQLKVLHQALVVANDWLMVDCEYFGSPVHSQLIEAISIVRDGHE